MALLDATLDIGMNAIIAAAPYLSIHTANPGTTGTSESTAARVAAGWAASANGDTTATNKSFTGGAASGPATYVGFWSAATGGVFRGSQVLTGDQTFNAAGAYTLTSVALNSAAS
jgi:hypothetical protein